MGTLVKMWKESGIAKNLKCRILFGVELLLLAAGVVGTFGSRGIVVGADSTHLLLEEGISLRPGVYEAKIYYRTEEDGVCSFGVMAEDAYFRGLLSNSVTLFSDNEGAVCQFYLKESVEHLKVYVEGQGTSPEIQGIEIVASPAGSRAFIFLVLLCSGLINVVIMLYLYHRVQPFDKLAQVVAAGLLLVFLCASLPLMVDYIIEAQDIAGLLTAIERVSRNPMDCLKPMDYLNSMDYLKGASVFLLVPAALRRVGFSMNLSYRLYVFLVNALTVAVAYVCFRGIFRNRLFGLTGSTLYTLNPFRISCIYRQAALGTYTVMIFIPLLLYGVYRLCVRKRNGKGGEDALWKWDMESRMGNGRKRNIWNICLGIVMALCFLAATCQTNEILMTGHPLWVYSMSDMENAQVRGLEYLPAETYGMEE